MHEVCLAPCGWLAERNHDPVWNALDPFVNAVSSLGMSEMLKLTVQLEDAGDGWVLASIPEVPGAISQGRTREEARENVIDALRTVLTPDEQLAGKPPDADDEPLTLTVA